jgi:hypothetical protein
MVKFASCTVIVLCLLCACRNSPTENTPSLEGGGVKNASQKNFDLTSRSSGNNKVAINLNNESEVGQQSSDSKESADGGQQRKNVTDSSVGMINAVASSTGRNKSSDDLRNIAIATLIGAFIGGAVSLGTTYAVGKSLGSALIEGQGNPSPREIDGMKRSDLTLKGGSSAVLYKHSGKSAGKVPTETKLIVFLPGNQLYQSPNYDEIFKGLSSTDSSVLTLNYRGMISGETAPSSARAWIDQSKALIRQAVELAGGDPRKVTVVGHSMGGAIGTYAISDLHNEGLPVKFVAHNTFSSFGDAAVAKGLTSLSAKATDAIAGLGGWELKVAEKFKSIPENYRIQFDAKNDSNIGDAQLGTKVNGKPNIVGYGHYTNIFSEKQFVQFNERMGEPAVQKPLRPEVSTETKIKGKAAGVGAAAGAAIGAGIQVIINKTEEEKPTPK